MNNLYTGYYVKTKIEELTDFKLHPDNSAQPNILLRLPLFTPSNRTKANKGHNLDVTKDFNNIKIKNKSGYNSVRILGTKMNMETDFKAWCGFIRIINENNFQQFITVKYKEFVKFCGYGSNRMTDKLRESLNESFLRIQNQSIQFTTKPRKNQPEEQSFTGSLIKEIKVDELSDTLQIEIDTNLLEIYRIDHVILLQLKILSKLARQETAQCLFVYLASLHETPYDISFDTLRERMNLTSIEKEQNRSITNAIKRLIEIGYLDAEIIRKKYKRYLRINNRCQFLTLALPREVISEPDRAEQIYNQILNQDNLDKITKKDMKILDANLSGLMMKGLRFDEIIPRIKVIKMNLKMS